MSAGISAFNKTASEKFQSLTQEDKCQLVAQVDDTRQLTESQISKKITDIFGKVRDRTVTKQYLYHTKRFVGIIIGFVIIVSYFIERQGLW